MSRAEFRSVCFRLYKRTGVYGMPPCHTSTTHISRKIGGVQVLPYGTPHTPFIVSEK